ncbi:MAG TPA: hypothetical protein PLB01_00735 [Thermoanaerobaculia bacterium]|nr:hypothetical protein [Thermoanaerobaculia bacterium]
MSEHHVFESALRDVAFAPNGAFRIRPTGADIVAAFVVTLFGASASLLGGVFALVFLANGWSFPLVEAQGMAFLVVAPVLFVLSAAPLVLHRARLLGAGQGVRNLVFGVLLSVFSFPLLIVATNASPSLPAWLRVAGVLSAGFIGGLAAHGVSLLHRRAAA